MSNRFLTKFTVNRRAVSGPELLRSQKYEEECKRTCGEHATQNYHALHCPYVKEWFGRKDEQGRDH